MRNSLIAAFEVIIEASTHVFGRYEPLLQSTLHPFALLRISVLLYIVNLIAA